MTACKECEHCLDLGYTPTGSIYRCKATEGSRVFNFYTGEYDVYYSSCKAINQGSCSKFEPKE